MKIQSSISRASRNRRKIPSVLVVLVAIVSLAVILSVQSVLVVLKQETSSVVPQNPSPIRDGLLQQSKQRYLPVDCTSRLAGRKEDPEDPNRTWDESPNTYINATLPHPFWISLHNRHFDPMRWASIMNRGNYYETGVTQQFSTMLANASKGLVVDIGMNIGWFTLYSRAMGHDVVGIEANPIMHTRVCESIALNHWNAGGRGSGVRTFPYGLGESITTLNLTMGFNPGGSSFHEKRLVRKFRRYREVPVITLDALGQEQGWLGTQREPVIHLTKIDVEGYESQVLRGGDRLLRSGRIQNLLMEHSTKESETVDELFYQLSGAGYEVHFISDVNGHDYHGEMVPRLNSRLQTDVKLDTALSNFFSKVTCNMWWNRRSAN